MNQTCVAKKNNLTETIPVKNKKKPRGIDQPNFTFMNVINKYF